MRGGIPIRTPEGIYAESYFDYKSDIYVFIEDENTQTRKITLELIQRAISKEIKINRIYSLGGKKEVLDKFKKKDKGRSEIYMVDGDLCLQYEDDEFKKGLVVLDRYCIENYLIDKNAIMNLLYEEAEGLDDIEELSEQFDYENWFNSQCSLLNSLFVEYAIEKMNSLGMQTVKYPVNKLRVRESNGKISCELDGSLVNQRIEKLKADIINKIGESKYKIDRSVLEGKNNNPNAINIVSAKDYILPLVFAKLKKVAKNSSAKEGILKHRLSKECEVEPFRRNLEPHLIS